MSSLVSKSRQIKDRQDRHNKLKDGQHSQSRLVQSVSPVVHWFHARAGLGRYDTYYEQEQINNLLRGKQNQDELKIDRQDSQDELKIDKNSQSQSMYKSVMHSGLMHALDYYEQINTFLCGKQNQDKTRTQSSQMSFC